MNPQSDAPKSNFCGDTGDDLAGYLREVEDRCKARGCNLTPIRKEVLALLYQHPNGLKAYDLLNQIKAERTNATPPTVYRALDFLIEQGLAHKIGRMNLFVACRHASHQLPSLFVVCVKCGQIAEIEATGAMKELTRLLGSAGYRLDAPEVEISAICPACAAAGWLFWSMTSAARTREICLSPRKKPPPRRLTSWRCTAAA